MGGFKMRENREMRKGKGQKWKVQDGRGESW